MTLIYKMTSTKYNHKHVCKVEVLSLGASSQAKDTKVEYTWPLTSLKIKIPAAPYHWMRSKPIASNQTIRNKKSSPKKDNTNDEKNKICRVCDEILQKKKKKNW